MELEVSGYVLSDSVGFPGKGSNRILKDLQQWEPESRTTGPELCKASQTISNVFCFLVLQRQIK